VVERLAGDQVAVRGVGLGVVGRPLLDDTAENVALVVGELAAVTDDLDTLEVAVADRDATLVFGVLAADVENGVDLDLQTLLGLEVDTRDDLLGGLDHRVAGDDITRVGGVGLLGGLPTRPPDVQRQRHLVAAFELAGWCRQRNQTQTEANLLVEHHTRVLDDADVVDAEGGHVGYHRAADAVRERGRNRTHEEACIPVALLDELDLVLCHD
jgi:hypothetical protein